MEMQRDEEELSAHESTDNPETQESTNILAANNVLEQLEPLHLAECVVHDSDDIIERGYFN